LWESELDVAVANAVTVLPWERRAPGRLTTPDSSPDPVDATAIHPGDPEEQEQT
jgi:hypothetical protein